MKKQPIISKILSSVLLSSMMLIASSTMSQQKIADYNVVWNTTSKNSSESMPCGAGDIGLNVWVENGDLLIYIARSGNFDENNALLKSGRLRLKLSPAVFDGNNFKQELHLQSGYITVSGEKNGVKATAKIWVDVFHPIAHVEVNSNKKVSAEVLYESWRYQDRVLQARENFGNSYKWAAPKKNIGKKDSIAFEGNKVVFYHNNQSPNIFDASVAQQAMDSVKADLYNPIKDLCFGGMLIADNFIAAGNADGKYTDTDFRGWKLKNNKPASSFAISVYLNNSQGTTENWRRSLDSLVATQHKRRAVNFTASQKWWNEFWNRSFIHIGKPAGKTEAEDVSRNYQLFRYMLAANAKGEWPTKFNGGLFTVDPVFTDSAHHLTPDYRNWGGGIHTSQNQRLVYFPSIKNGDWDILQAQLNFYLRLQKNAELRSKVYWGHGGASFTEQLENYGLPNYAEYGQGRPAWFDKGVEYNAWLEHQWDTVLEFCLMMLEEEAYTGRDITDRITFIESCLRFFDEHYQYLAKLRGRKALTDEGKLILFPGSGAETFKMAYNASSTIAGLQVLSQRLLALPAKYATEEKRKLWLAFSKKIPVVPYTNVFGKTTIAPAITWERINNTESPQLYPVYPWNIYGVGKPGLDTALNTWKYDTNVIKFRSHIGWKQDNIWAARLGLAADAWKLTSAKLKNSGRRFPAFWGPGFDWVPDHNWGGSGMIGLQEMLLQTDGQRILLLPSWPTELDVHFKLHAPGNTTVEAVWKNGKMERLTVVPEARRGDVEIM
ncbi:DUF5703 domain-containing protein [Terrimonas sp. NA20]|uniref:DUF5703 domain-containing protein n=1 Tax=Terrimonas ginsenosidimutans TaxID=2908004 RepID=A0ABS9KR64_9BACT|nr:DUF5703 domain-containing protein [Terrimonas ginsenosidimutans]MCG2614792.1 DUF5703 domain-containing protein [Terrimonas ginsenosidimutans]